MLTYKLSTIHASQQYLDKLMYSVTRQLPSMIRSLYKYFLAITMGTNDMASDISDTKMTHQN